MAAFAVAANEVGHHDQALVASTADTVSFDRDCDRVRVVNVNGAAAIYVRVDGTAATVAGKATHMIPGIAGAVREITVPTAGDTVVSLISSGAASYSVEGLG